MTSSIQYLVLILSARSPHREEVKVGALTNGVAKNCIREAMAPKGPPLKVPLPRILMFVSSVKAKEMVSVFNSIIRLSLHYHRSKMNSR